LREMENQFREYRMTPQRKVVLEILLENKDRHLSAEEVFQISRGKGLEIGMATIYRTLELLEDLGLSQKLNFGDGRSRYELVQKNLTDHQHHHLLCLNCECIIEVEEDLLHQLEEVVRKKHNFEIVNHNLQFFGYCSSCRNQK